MAYVVERKRNDGTTRYLGCYRDPEGRIRSAGTHSTGSIALSDRKRTTPQVFRPGDGRRTHPANTTPTSDGQDGRLSAQCDSQPEESPAP
jgi:hypothetical protein